MLPITLPPLGLSVPANGHPDDKWGFAVGAGIKLNVPMIGQRDYLQAQINYTQGALRYVFQTPNSNWGKIEGSSAGFGNLSDAVYAGTLGGTGVFAATDLELTTTWNINVAYEHFWNPRWRTSLYGGYAAVTYNDVANALVCEGNLFGFPGCDQNWGTWWLGSRTQWNVTGDFYVGLDVMYAKLRSAEWRPDMALTPSGGAVPKTDPDNWQFRFRVHRDFYP